MNIQTVSEQVFALFLFYFLFLAKWLEEQYIQLGSSSQLLLCLF